MWDYFNALSQRFKKGESCFFLFLNAELQGKAIAQEATDSPSWDIYLPIKDFLKSRW